MKRKYIKFKDSFLAQIEIIFLKYGLFVSVQPYQSYYAVWTYNNYYNSLLWFLVETAGGQKRWVDVLDNNNQLVILGISTGDCFPNHELDKMLSQVFEDLNS